MTSRQRPRPPRAHRQASSSSATRRHHPVAARKSPRRIWPAISGTGAGHLRRWASTESASQSASASASGRVCRLTAAAAAIALPGPAANVLGVVADVLARGIEQHRERVCEIHHPVLRTQPQANGQVQRVVFGEPPPRVQQAPFGPRDRRPAKIAGVARRRLVLGVPRRGVRAPLASAKRCRARRSGDRGR
jgi:hypothetical protein